MSMGNVGKFEYGDLWLSESWESPSHTDGDTPTIELKCIVGGTTVPSEAKGFFKWTTPTIYKGLVRQSTRVQPQDGAVNLWECTATYGRKKQQPETGESEWTFDTGGGTQKVLCSLATKEYHASGFAGIASEIKGSIGVKRSGKGTYTVDGCDITVPQFVFSETHYLAAGLVTWDYAATLCELTGKTNASAWRAFAAGQVLFLGASGRQRGEEDWAVTFKFVAGRNLTDLTIGEITGIQKKAWQYMDIIYQDVDNDTAHAILPKAIVVTINDVYHEGNFALLGIS